MKYNKPKLKLRLTQKQTTRQIIRVTAAIAGIAGMIVFSIMFIQDNLNNPKTAEAAVATHTSLRDGSWTNTSNVWSTNGTTACGCSPGTSVTGIVNINHIINLNTDVTITSGGSINISTTGQLYSGGSTMTVSNGLLESYNVFGAKEITINASGTGNFYGPVTAQSKFIVSGAVLFDSLVTIVNASLELRPGSVTTAGDGWEIDIPNGNIYNQGHITFYGTCLVMNNGSFYNQVGGTIAGEGFIETENGNFYNTGISWDTDVNWCASGSGSGMPEGENCISAFCGGTPLPVTLIGFTGKAENNKVLLSWATVAEANNDYFTIERSSNNNHFTQLTTVDGAGNSTMLLKYLFTDENPLGGTSYYRLKQTDFNGTSETFKTISVTIKTKQSASSAITVFPNPFTDSFTAVFESGESSELTILLIAANGETVFSDKTMAEEGSNQYHFTTPAGLKAGTYMLQLRNANATIGSARVVCRK